MTGTWLLPLATLLCVAAFLLWQVTYELWRRDRLWISALLGRTVAVVTMIASVGVFVYGVTGGLWEPTKAPASVTERTLTTAQSAAATCRSHGGVSRLDGGGWTSLQTVVVCRDGVASDLDEFATVPRSDAAARLEAWNERHTRRVERTGQVLTVAGAALALTFATIVLLGLTIALNQRRGSQAGATA